MEFVSELKENYSPLMFARQEKKYVPEIKPTKPRKIKGKVFYSTVPFLLVPGIASANDDTGGNTFLRIYDTVMDIFDYGVVLVIIFAGASWALGHRSKAIELLICACSGYILAMHAVEIRDFLKSIKG